MGGGLGNAVLFSIAELIIASHITATISGKTTNI